MIRLQVNEGRYSRWHDVIINNPGEVTAHLSEGSVVVELTKDTTIDITCDVSTNAQEPDIKHYDITEVDFCYIDSSDAYGSVIFTGVKYMTVK